MRLFKKVLDREGRTVCCVRKPEKYKIKEKSMILAKLLNLFKKRQKESQDEKGHGYSRITKVNLQKKNINCLLSLLGTIECARGFDKKSRIAQKGIKVLINMNRLA